MKKDTERKGQRQVKKPYKKPQLGKVALFADQVMGSCKVMGISSGCNTFPRS
jgi:hypothetical protein